MPHGLKGNALAHVESVDDDDDMGMGEEEGWQSEYTQWWFDFLNEKGGKGVSKDTWVMVCCLPSFSFLWRRSITPLSSWNSSEPSTPNSRNTTRQVSCQSFDVVLLH